MVVLPTTHGNDLGIGFSLKDSDLERGTAITVSGDFGLLSPEGKAAL